MSYLICFLFAILLISAPVEVAGDEKLLAAVKKTAGLLRDNILGRSNATSSTPIHPDLAKTVLVTVANYGYLNHLQNFLCFTERLGMEPLIVSMDEKLHNYITSRTSFVSYLFDTTGKTSVHIDSGAAGWRSQQFILISNLKIVAALEVMKLGYNVLFADPDVVILRNPMHHLLWKNVDYVHSMNAPCNM